MGKLSPNPKLLYIEWLDSKGITNEWEYFDEIMPMKPNTCRSIGFLIEETKEYKTLAPNISETQVLGRITIPLRSIIKIVELKV